MYIGAHIKKESSILKTIHQIKKEGGNALQIFVSNPRSVQLSNITKYKEESSDILKYCNDNNFKLVIHAPYTINMAKPLIDGKRTLEYKDCYWNNLIINNLEISDIIGSIGVVFHVGKYTNYSPDEGKTYMYNNMKYVIEVMKEKKISSKLILETPAGAGTELLTDVNDFISFYNLFNDDDKKYLGICLDTAHIWSSGYDINTYYKEVAKENSKNIIVIHFNNSKKDKRSCADVHENIFDGKISQEDMRLFLTKLKHNPVIILEKPSDNLNKDFTWMKKST